MRVINPGALHRGSVRTVACWTCKRTNKFLELDKTEGQATHIVIGRFLFLLLGLGLTGEVNRRRHSQNWKCVKRFLRRLASGTIHALGQWTEVAAGIGAGRWLPGAEGVRGPETGPGPWIIDTMTMAPSGAAGRRSGHGLLATVSLTATL